jgi:iron complex outermembrane receptor protein
MTMKKLVLFFFIFYSGISLLLAQEKKDSVAQLESILIKGYESNAKSRIVPASISTISQKDIQKLSSFSLLPAFNNVSGVRMEERSPGSYRLSVRGSLLRSPFGVRNVKIYLNDFMLTDAGGNTYINLLDVNSVGQTEIIKGPSGSLYGAGTGGTVLFSTPTSFEGRSNDTSSFNVALSGGSFGSFNEKVSYQHQSKNFSAKLTQTHNQSEGYREQSRLRKDNIQYQFKSSSAKNMFTEGIILLSDLYYQTPGGLNAAQYAADPLQARPATAVLPSATSQQTAIFNKTALMGFSNTFLLSDRWKTVTSFTTSITSFKNPFITNFEKRREVNVGIRTKLVYEKKEGMPLQWVSGAEVQNGSYKIDSSGNIKGVSDGNSVIDKIGAKQLFVFSQVGFSPLSFLRIQGGISINAFNYNLERIKGLPSNGNVPVDFNTQFLPRLAVMVDVLPALGIYGQVSKGYSAPSIAEVRPSAGGFFTGLQAEYGWNKEIGFKLNAMRNRFTWTVCWFDFRLKDAIVRQTNAAGAEYFINAGSTIQQGVESDLSFLLINKNSTKGINYLKISQSLTSNRFSFNQYMIGATSYSGKKLTGVPNEVAGLSVDAAYFNGFYSSINLNYTGKIPLNDANTAMATDYRLWQFKTGWKKSFKKYNLDFFMLIDNLGNARYSLGNDLNAFGSRFFNASPKRNFTGGFVVDF